MPQDLWLPLLMIAACLFPLDAAVRVLMWGESEWRSSAGSCAQPQSATGKHNEYSTRPFNGSTAPKQAARYHEYSDAIHCRVAVDRDAARCHVTGSNIA
jgi:hypothetical protein